MSRSSAAPDQSYVIRDGGSTAIFWLAVVVAAVFLGFIFLNDSAANVVRTIPWTLLALWILWLVLYRPHIRYTSAQAIVVNIGRVHTIPWSRVEAVRQRLGIVFELDDGRRVTSAGATAPRGHGTVVGGITGRRGVDGHEFNRSAAMLDSIRESARPTDDLAFSRWDIVPLGIGGTLAVLAAIDLIVTVSM